MGCSRSAVASASSWSSAMCSLVFLGSDAFSVSVLQSLAPHWQARVHVVTPGETRKGRHRQTLHCPPLLQLAKQWDLPVTVLPRVATNAPPCSLAACLPAVDPDDAHVSLLVTASFPHFVPADVLDRFPDRHCLNVHPSLLPQYRGAAPLQWQIADQVEHIGVTVQTLSPRAFDHGDILSQTRFTLQPSMEFCAALGTSGQLGGQLLSQTLDQFPHYKAHARSQFDMMGAATTPLRRARKIQRSDASIDWSNWSSSQTLARHLAISHQYALWTTVMDGSIIQLQPISSSVTPPATSCPTFSNSSSSSFSSWLSSLSPGTAILDRRQDVLYIKCRSRPYANTSSASFALGEGEEEGEGREMPDQKADWITVDQVKTIPYGKGWMKPTAWWNGRVTNSLLRHRPKESPINVIQFMVAPPPS